MATPLVGLSGSPVIVDGKVAGHLREVVSDPDHPGRPAFGVFVATRVGAVRRLLGLPDVETAPPDRPDDDGHVFVSYRSTERRFARELVSGLEARGLRVFLAEKDLAAGDSLSASLDEAVGKARAAVALISPGWLESPWCEAESNVLLHRSIEVRGFRLVPVRLGGAELPPLMRAKLWVDAPGNVLTQQVLDRIADGVRARPAPAAGTKGAMARQARDEVMERILADLKAAAATAAWRVLRAWQRVPAGVDPTQPSLIAAQALISMGEPERALEVLGLAGDGPRATQLRALALGKLGRFDEAIELLIRLSRLSPLDPETLGILGGRYKERSLRGRDAASLSAANACYEAAWRAKGDTYNGINAAATALWLGERSPSKSIARGVLQRVEEVADPDAYTLATRAEAHLLLGDVDEARRSYRAAVGKAPQHVSDIATMRRQARVHLPLLHERADALDDVLPVPRAVAFTGHMTDAPGRPAPRFPVAEVPRVREAIRRVLASLDGPAVGFGSLARGADLLVAEELLARGLRVQAWLPFSAEAFKRTSVGGAWDGRFDKVVNQLPTEHLRVLGDVPGPGGEAAAFSACNARIMREAFALARLFDQVPLLVAVWDGRVGDGPGGTAETVEAWRLEGGQVEIIAPTA